MQTVRKKTRAISTFFLLVLFNLSFNNISFAEERKAVLIQTGFITGNDYRALSQERRLSYVVGLTDGIFLSPFYGAPEAISKKIKECIVGMTDQQLVAITDKYLQNNPERWHDDMHVLFYSTLIKLCGPMVAP